MTYKWPEPKKKQRWLHKIGLKKLPYKLGCDFRSDGFGTKGKSLKFMNDPAFIDAWNASAETGFKATGNNIPDIRWRAHIALWAAQSCLKLEGDFVECGVFTGIFSMAICHYFNFANVDKKFWLFDSWEGIPVEQLNLSAEAQTLAKQHNEANYRRYDIFTSISESFSKYPNCKLVKGMLPETLEQAELNKIAFLSIDLNNAPSEKECIEKLWSKITTGGIVLIDDYGWVDHKDQQDMWDEFAASKGLFIVTLPTGQGILTKQ